MIELESINSRVIEVTDEFSRLIMSHERHIVKKLTYKSKVDFYKTINNLQDLLQGMLVFARHKKINFDSDSDLDDVTSDNESNNRSTQISAELVSDLAAIKRSATTNK